MAAAKTKEEFSLDCQYPSSLDLVQRLAWNEARLETLVNLPARRKDQDLIMDLVWKTQRRIAILSKLIASERSYNTIPPPSCWTTNKR